MNKNIGYKDWDKVVKACEREFELIKNTRVSMDVAEQCQLITYELALQERAKFSEPVIMAEEKEKPKEETSPEETSEEKPKE